MLRDIPKDELINSLIILQEKNKTLKRLVHRYYNIIEAYSYQDRIPCPYCQKKNYHNKDCYVKEALQESEDV